MGPNLQDTVDVTDILSYFGNDMVAARRRYKEFVEAGINDDIRNPFKEAKEGIIPNSNGFC